MMQIPRYTEGLDPGFREYLAVDFAEPTPETQEQLALRNKLKKSILAEFERLELEPENWEYFVYSKLGVLSIDNCDSLFAIQEFLSWLQKVESRRI